MKNFTHTPVLLNEVIYELNVKKGEKYIDATIGGGGHTQEILKKGGIVLGIDQDLEAVQYVSKKFNSKVIKSRLKTVWGNFKDIAEIATKNGFESVSGILFDLGVSSHQLESPERGFSLRIDAPLDMRMDKTKKVTAKDIVNTYSKEALEDLFLRYAEEENAGIIASKIVSFRKNKKIETTGELVKIIESVVKRKGVIHPATKVFQALRIEVNQELDNLKKALEDGFKILRKDGRIIVISFHSLEDRIVKRTFENWQNRKLGNVLFKKPIKASENELLSNPRARSAKMRAFEKN